MAPFKLVSGLLGALVALALLAGCRGTQPMTQTIPQKSSLETSIEHSAYFQYPRIFINTFQSNFFTTAYAAK